MPANPTTPGPHLGRGAFSPVILDRAAGTSVFTEDGREVLDFTSGKMGAIRGPAILDQAVTDVTG